jgi:hypothetical protein
MASPFTPIIMDSTSGSHTGAEALVQQQEERLAATGGGPNPRRRTMFRLEDGIPEAMETSGSMAPGTEPGTEQQAMQEEEDIEAYFSQEVSRIDDLDRITEQTGPAQVGQGQANTPRMLPRTLAYVPGQDSGDVQQRVQQRAQLYVPEQVPQAELKQTIYEQVNEQVQKELREARRLSAMSEQRMTLEMQEQRKMLETINATIQAQARGNGRDERQPYGVYDGAPPAALYGPARGLPSVANRVSYGPSSGPTMGQLPGVANRVLYGDSSGPTMGQPYVSAGTPVMDNATATMLATVVSQASTLMANSHNHSEKVSFTSVKDTDDAARTILMWEREFQAANIPIDNWVKKALALMSEGGNLRAWAQNYENKYPGRTNHDPTFIHNWSWQHFVAQLRDSNLWKEPDPASLIKRMKECKCDPEGDEAAIIAYVMQFQNCKAELDAYDLLHAFFTEAGLATQLLQNLPPYFRKFMNRRRDPGPKQQLRYCIVDTIAEIRQTQRDEECKQVMQQKIKQPTKLTGANAATSPKLGQATDYAAYLLSPASFEDVKRVLMKEREQQGPSMEFRIKDARQPGLQFIIITHPSSAYLSKLPDAHAHLQLAWTGINKGPRPNLPGGSNKQPLSLANMAHQVADLQAAQAKMDDMVSQLSVTGISSSSAELKPSDSVSQVAAQASTTANRPVAANTSAVQTEGAQPYQRPRIPWINPPSGSEAIVFGHSAMLKTPMVDMFRPPGPEYLEYHAPEHPSPEGFFTLASGLGGDVDLCGHV